MAAKFSMLVKNMLTLTTLSMLLPAALRTSERFVRACFCLASALSHQIFCRIILSMTDGRWSVVSVIHKFLEAGRFDLFIGERGMGVKSRQA
jgi:hypothetical protein